MPAHEHLGPQFFHGTDVDLPEGAQLVPGQQLGRDNAGLGDNEHVFVTDDPTVARQHGPNVYRVQPEGLPSRSGAAWEHRYDTATVLGRYEEDD